MLLFCSGLGLVEGMRHTSVYDTLFMHGRHRTKFKFWYIIEESDGFVPGRLVLTSLY